MERKMKKLNKNINVKYRTSKQKVSLEMNKLNKSEHPPTQPHETSSPSLNKIKFTYFSNFQKIKMIQTNKRNYENEKIKMEKEKNESNKIFSNKNKKFSGYKNYDYNENYENYNTGIKGEVHLRLNQILNFFKSTKNHNKIKHKNINENKIGNYKDNEHYMKKNEKYFVSNESKGNETIKQKILKNKKFHYINKIKTVKIFKDYSNDNIIINQVSKIETKPMYIRKISYSCPDFPSYISSTSTSSFSYSSFSNFSNSFSEINSSFDLNNSSSFTLFSHYSSILSPSFEKNFKFKKRTRLKNKKLHHFQKDKSNKKIINIHEKNKKYSNSKKNMKKKNKKFKNKFMISKIIKMRYLKNENKNKINFYKTKNYKIAKKYIKINNNRIVINYKIKKYAIKKTEKNRKKEKFKNKEDFEELIPFPITKYFIKLNQYLRQQQTQKKDYELIKYFLQKNLKNICLQCLPKIGTTESSKNDFQSTPKFSLYNDKSFLNNDQIESNINTNIFFKTDYKSFQLNDLDSFSSSQTLNKISHNLDSCKKLLLQNQNIKN